jgi:hypothetical protein
VWWLTKSVGVNGDGTAFPRQSAERGSIRRAAILRRDSRLPISPTRDRFRFIKATERDGAIQNGLLGYVAIGNQLLHDQARIYG